MIQPHDIMPKSMKYAVIQLAGKQYKVTEGEELTVNSLQTKEGEKIEISDVLLVADGKAVKIGEPVIKGAKVVLNVISNQKSAKLRVAKYKAKSRYRKTHGHRQVETTVKVAAIQ